MVAGLGTIVQGDTSGLVQVDTNDLFAAGSKELDVHQFQATGLGHLGGTG